MDNLVRTNDDVVRQALTRLPSVMMLAPGHPNYSLAFAMHATMKRKASQELSKEGTEEVAEEGEDRQVASSVTVIDQMETFRWISWFLPMTT